MQVAHKEMPSFQLFCGNLCNLWIISLVRLFFGFGIFPAGVVEKVNVVQCEQKHQQR